MQKTSFLAIFRRQLSLIFLSILIFISGTQNSFAVIDRVRNVKFDNDGCQTDKISFDPFSTNPDILWEIDNPTCASYLAVSGASILAAVNISSWFCQNQQASIIQAASIAAGVGLSPKMVKDRVKEWATCTRSTINCATSGGANSVECSTAASCCASAAATAATVGVAVGALSIIWQAAVDSQKNAHICGEKWNVWQERDRKQNGSDDAFGIPDYAGDSNDKMYVFGKLDGSYQQSLERNYNSGAMQRKISNKSYREYIYGGMEFEDNGNGACKNPEKWSDATKDEILGYHSDNQRYYMRGPSLASNYACGRFLLHRGSEEEKNSAKTAYECCKQRSQETICIEEANAVANNFASSTGVSGTDSGVIDNFKSHKFCKLGERCKVQNVWYEIYGSQKVPNYLCAKTYSVCPYNHLLGGGTEIAKYDEKYPSILENQCQYLKHCVKIPAPPYIRTNSMDGAWISSACRDLKGDSQNNYGYSADLVPINTKNFSAPIAQCFKETLENMFVNRAGDNQCNDPNEQPNADGKCLRSGNKYSKGEVIRGEESFFQTIQSKLQFAIKAVMSVAITVMGIGVLLTGTPADKKTILMFVIKLGLVSYFALGTGWQDGFFENVSGVSVAMADVFMQIDPGQGDRQDGCQFPKYNYAWSEGMPGSKYDNPSYPPGKEYLRVWDMFDCKIARALGLGPDASVPNLFFMALAGLLSSYLGFLGLVFFAATFIFAFYLIALVVRALHIFLISSMAITLMVYVSPITITACLFKRTNSIFSSWWKQLLGFVLQPVMLFAFLGILITLFEGTIMGDATFTGDGIDAPKQINCSTGNAENNSIYCIFNIKDIKTNNALAPIGVGLPLLVNMNQEKIATIIKAVFIMFIFTKFLDAFIGDNGLMHGLVGGARLASNSKGGMESLQKAFGYANAMRTRATNGIRKHGTSLAKRAGGAVKSAVRDLGKQTGKSIGKALRDKQAGPAGNDVGRSGDSSTSKPTSTPSSSGGTAGNDVGKN